MLIPALRRAPALVIALLASAAAADTPPSAAGQRLGTDVMPLSQTVRLVADARKPDYAGSVRVELEVRRPAAGFALHAEEMDIRRLALSGPRGAVDVSGLNSGNLKTDLMAAAKATGGLEIKQEGPGAGRSDDSNFLDARVPAVNFFTGFHTDYHRPTDDWDKIDKEGTARVAALALEFAARIAQNSQLRK